MPKELSRLQALLEHGLADTAALWPAVRVGFRWVHQAAHILSNQDQREALTIQRRLGGLLGAMTRYQAAAGTLASARGHFRKVTRSYWPGLFACYTAPDLPRTNNDLEQFFGAYRYHDRRTTGRKVASRSLVLNDSLGIIAERLRDCSATLPPTSLPRTSMPGKSYDRPERPAANNGLCGGASAVIPRHILRSLKRTYSN